MALFAIATLVGCEGLLGFADFLPGAPRITEAGTEASAPENGDANWYVSPTGDDKADGSKGRPLRSVTEAIRRAAAALGGQGETKSAQRVAVCAGEYPETALSIEGAIELRGNYDCATWVRPPNDDSATGPTVVSRSKIVSAAPVDAAFVSLESRPSGSPMLDSLAIDAKGVGAAVAVRGNFTMTRLSITVEPVPGAVPKDLVTGVLVTNGDGIVDHSSIDVRRSVEGSGTLLTTGVVLQEGTAALRRNRIRVHEAAGLCVGVLVTGEGAFNVSENDAVLESCVGQPLPELRVTAMGFALESGNTTSERNRIRFLTPGHAGNERATTIGVRTGTKGRYTGDGDHVIGPNALNEQFKPSSLSFVGFYDEGALRSLVNASIELDSRTYGLEETSGVLLTKPSDAYLAHNSMYFTQSAAQTTIPVRAFYLRSDLQDAGTSKVTLESNLVATDEPRAVFVRTSCTAPGVARLANNRHAGFSAPTFNCTDGGLDDLATTTIPERNDRFVCPTEAGCAAMFLPRAGDVPPGLRLEPDAGCGRGLEVPFIPAVADDGSGKPRSDAGTTAGAFELGCK